MGNHNPNHYKIRSRKIVKQKNYRLGCFLAVSETGRFFKFYIMAQEPYSLEEVERIFEEILEYIEEGKSLRSILRASDMPSSRTFFKWIDSDKDKVKRYTRAMEIRAESIFEDMLEIADDGTNDFMTITKGDVTYNVEDKEVTNRSRLRLDTRKFFLSKVLPKKYGDKLDVTSDGDALQAPKKIIIKVNRRTDEDI